MVNVYQAIGAEEINQFVKFRNNVTHGRYRIIDTVVGSTAIALQGAVYCCLLGRIGFDWQQLEKLCAEKKFPC